MKTYLESMKRGGWIYLLVILIFGIMVYRDALMPGKVLFTTDDNIGAIALRKSTFPHGFLGGWDDSIAVGQPNNTPISSTNLLLWMMSPKTFVNWIHTIDLVLGSWFLMLFLRLRGIGWLASIMGALLACWFGSTFFLTYAGHIGKFGVVMCGSIYLYLIERAIRDRSVSFAILAGVAMGGMFIEQSDSGLFFALVLGPYALFRGWQAFRFNIAAHARIILPLVVITAMMALHSVYSAYSFYRMDKPEMTEQGNTWQELWDYCTQWSWPPSETIEFIAPGYMGWRSGEPSGPYWGALGRYPQWRPEFGPGGMNFKLETFYKGFIPIMFLCFGIFAFLVRKRDDQGSHQQMWFWVSAMVVTFILACGKYLPLYRLFFELPGISSIRNPVKFMQITQIAMGIIAAYGMDYWLRAVSRDPVKNDPDAPVVKSFAKAVFYAAIAFTVFTLWLGIRYSGSIADFTAQGWQDLAPRIVATRMSSVVHLAIMAWIGYALIRLSLSRGSIKYTTWRHVGWAALLVVMVDQLLISRRYVQSADTASLVSEGALIPALRDQLGGQRAYFWSPNTPGPWQGVYNQWLTILLPYYQVPAINVGQMRMSDDYKQYYAAMNQRPLQMWSHMGLGMVFTPADFWLQIRNDPSLRDTFEPVAGYNVVAAGKTGATTIQVFGQQQPQHLLLRYRRPADRYALISAWRAEELGPAIQSLSRMEPLTVALIDPDGMKNWPASGEPGRTGSVKLKSYRAGRIELEVSTTQPAVLRAAEKFTPDWKAWVDGQEAPVHRCDAIFLGVLIEPSETPRDVVLAFHPQRKTLYLQLAGLSISALALVGALFVRTREPV